jgi:hypothetical protein
LSHKVMTISQDFWSNVNKTDSCWLWTRAISSRGYGVFQVDSKLVYAHRYSFLQSGRVLLEGEEVCHTCDVKHCVRDDHLVAGSHQYNLSDAVSKGLVPRGEDKWNAKLTEQDVVEIRSLSRNGYSSRQIADMYNISDRHIRGIVTRRYWKHVSL